MIYNYIVAEMLRSFLGRTPLLVFYHTPHITSQSPVSLNMYYRVPKFELSLPQILQTSAKSFMKKKLTWNHDLQFLN